MRNLNLWLDLHHIAHFVNFYRPNIFLNIDCSAKAEILPKLEWYFQKLKTETISCPKAIIFVRLVQVHLAVASFLFNVYQIAHLAIGGVDNPYIPQFQLFRIF
jgi:hypothetical protein